MYADEKVMQKNAVAAQARRKGSDDVDPRAALHEESDRAKIAEPARAAPTWRIIESRLSAREVVIGSLASH